MYEKKKPIIIELNGLPGCGKTTLTRSLYKKLRDLDYKVGMFEEVIVRINFKEGKRRKYLKLLSFHNIKFTIELIHLYLSIKPFKIKRLRFIKNISSFYIIYQEVLNSNDYDVIL